MNPKYDERSVLKRISEGDEIAFSDIYLRYKPLLYRFVFNILKSADQTNDSCQDIFIKIWEDRARLPDVISFKHYLLTVAKNHSINVLRKMLSDEKMLASFVTSYNEQVHDVEDEIQSAEYKHFISSVLLTLTPQSKRIFQLCRQQGLSYDEAAEEVGVSRNIIKKHMIKSMKIFRHAVEKDFGIALKSLICISSHLLHEYL
ncbi:RNA polymerase sigma-70 factor, ECF subfamily [Dyadobacter sp. SG02]|uniref:RNA polymerase sigma factor n=1 Tax=Dyadobacter sp. SG02 TaxID=1855291 RepID=UPI0008D1419D|nr:sigma-70 family RNA polymerase sigma factor [Dyadobacter sp. SG02]SEJ36582.1 RNA polymerase sigma-70 factor, ECF subfamily [Dyadobacter sp. SG02]